MDNDKKLNILNLNIARYIRLCFRYWYIFVICMLITGGLTLVYSLVKQPVSEVVAQLMLKDEAPSAGLLSSQIANGLPFVDMFGSSSTDNETAVMSSHAVFLGAVKDLDLNISYLERKYPMVWYNTPLTSAVKLVAPDGMADTIRVSIVFDVVPLDNGNADIKVKCKRKTIARLDNKSFPINVSTIYGDFTILKTKEYDTTEANKFRILFYSYDSSAESYAELVKVFAPDRKTDFIDLSFVTPDPRFGKMVLNSIINNYVRVSNIYKTDRNKQSLDLINDRLSSLSGDLIKSEAGLEKFKKENDLTNVEVDASYLIGKSSTLEGSLLETRTKYEVLKMTRDFLDNPENRFALIPDVGVAQIEKYNNLILSRMSLLNSAKPNNNTVKQLDEQIDAVRQNVIESVDRLMSNTMVTINDLKAEENKTKSKMGQIPTLEREYITLKRDNMLQEQIYLFLLRQREEINMSMATKSLPAQVIDAPYALSDTGLSLFMKLVVALFLGFVAAAAYVLFVVMRKSPVSAHSEIAGNSKLPVLHSIPAFDDGVKTVVTTTDRAAEDIRLLRAEVQNALSGCNGNVVAVTSINDGEGKTSVAVNLAASLAMTGKRVALVDASLRNPRIKSLLDINGAKDYVMKNIRGAKTESLGMDSYEIDQYTTLDVAIADTPSANAADILASERFADFVSALAKSYDYVVLDSSRIKGLSDIYYITDISDITLVVSRKGFTTPKDVDMLNDLFSNGKLKRMALVLNGF